MMSKNEKDLHDLLDEEIMREMDSDHCDCNDPDCEKCNPAYDEFNDFDEFGDLDSLEEPDIIEEEINEEEVMNEIAQLTEFVNNVEEAQESVVFVARQMNMSSALPTFIFTKSHVLVVFVARAQFSSRVAIFVAFFVRTEILVAPF